MEKSAPGTAGRTVASGRRRGRMRPVKGTARTAQRTGRLRTVGVERRRPRFTTPPPSPSATPPPLRRGGSSAGGVISVCASLPTRLRLTWRCSSTRHTPILPHLWGRGTTEGGGGGSWSEAWAARLPAWILGSGPRVTKMEKSAPGTAGWTVASGRRRERMRPVKGTPRTAQRTGRLRTVGVERRRHVPRHPLRCLRRHLPRFAGEDPLQVGSLAYVPPCPRGYG